MKKIIWVVLAASGLLSVSARDYAYRLEWLQGPGNGKFLTNYKPNMAKTCIETKVCFTNVTGKTQCIFCVRGSKTSTKTYSMFLIGDTGKPRMDYNSDASKGTFGDYRPAANEDIVISTCGPSGTWTDAAGVAHPCAAERDPVDEAAGNYLGFFHSYYNGASKNNDNYGLYKMYYFRVGETNAAEGTVTAKFDYVPVLGKDGVVELYDTLDGAVLAPTAGTFIAGPRAAGDVEADIDSDQAAVRALFTAENGFLPCTTEPIEGLVADGETVEFRAPTKALTVNDGVLMTVTGWDLYEFDNANKTEVLVQGGEGTAFDYTYKSDKTPRLVWKVAYQVADEKRDLMLAKGETRELFVPADGTVQVRWVLGTGGTIRKVGEGALEIQAFSNGTAQIVVEEGTVHISNPRPTEVFKDAYLHLDASDLSTLDIETVNGTNFVNQWFDVDGGVHFATNCTTVWNGRTDPANRRPFLVNDGLNGLPYVHFGSILTRHATNEFGQALGYGAAMKLDSSVYMSEGFTVFSDTEDYKDWKNLGYSIRGQTPMALETGDGWLRCDIGSDGLSNWGYDTSPSDAHFPQDTSPTNLVVDLEYLTTRVKFCAPSAGFHLVRVLPAVPLNVGHLAAERVGTSSVTSDNRVYGGQKIAEYMIFRRTLSDAERDAVSRYLWTKWFPVKLDGVTVKAGAKLLVDDDVALAPAFVHAEDGAELSLGHGETVLDPLADGNCVLRLDASDATTMDIVRENGTNFVERWRDANGRSVYAVTNMATGKCGQRTDPEKRLPYISEGLTASGLPVVDFGTPLLIQVPKATTSATATGYGASMRLSSTLETGEFLAVAEDNEELTNRTDTVTQSAYLAVEDGSNVGRRGSASPSKNAPLYASVSSDGNGLFLRGTHYVNGESAKWSDVPPIGEFYLLDSALEKTYGSFDSIARYYRLDSQSIRDCFGGLRYAELAVFKVKLPEDERLRANRRLRAKWFGDAYEEVPRTYAKLAVPRLGSFRTAYDPVVVTDTLTLGGKLTLEKSVTVANLAVTAVGAEIAAPLTLGAAPELSFVQDGTTVSGFKVDSLALPAAGTLTLSVTNEKILRGKKVKLIDCAAITGSLDGWTINVTGCPLGVSFALVEDGLTATFNRPGSVLLVR